MAENVPERQNIRRLILWGYRFLDPVFSSFFTVAEDLRPLTKKIFGKPAWAMFFFIVLHRDDDAVAGTEISIIVPDFAPALLTALPTSSRFVRLLFTMMRPVSVNVTRSDCSGVVAQPEMSIANRMNPVLSFCRQVVLNILSGSFF